MRIHAELLPPGTEELLHHPAFNRTNATETWTSLSTELGHDHTVQKQGLNYHKPQRHQILQKPARIGWTKPWVDKAVGGTRGWRSPRAEHGTERPARAGAQNARYGEQSGDVRTSHYGFRRKKKKKMEKCIIKPTQENQATRLISPASLQAKVFGGGGRF